MSLLCHSAAKPKDLLAKATTPPLLMEKAASCSSLTSVSALPEPYTSIPLSLPHPTLLSGNLIYQPLKRFGLS